jgi:hypothetical protein
MRGAALAGMVLANWNYSALPFLSHSPWDGLTFNDVVCPVFLFVMGMSQAAVGLKRPVDIGRASLRALKMCALGMVIKNLPADTDLSSFRIPSVLGRLAMSYLTSLAVQALANLSFWGPRSTARHRAAPELTEHAVEWTIVACLVLVHTLVILLAVVPGMPLLSLSLSFSLFALNY